MKLLAINIKTFLMGPQRTVLTMCALSCLLLFPAACSKEGGSSFMQTASDGKTGSKFFVAKPDDIVTDKETGLQVIKDVFSITLSPTATDETAKMIASSVKGEIVGYDYSVNFYQIRLPEADLATIKKIRLQILGEFKEVETASICPVSAKKNPFYVK